MMRDIIYSIYFLCVISSISENVGAFRRSGGLIPRIIGGQEATPHAYPYQVGIYVTYAGTKDFCGGSLVSPNYVLTAAHCASGAINMSLIIGAHDITEQESTQIRITSNTFIVHPQWDKKKLENDIALVKLPSPIKETSSIKSIRIVSGKNTYAGSKGTITGWGKTSNNQSAVTKKLRFVTSEIISNDDCKKVDGDYAKIIHPTVLCVSGKGQVGSCAGDSGGPLMVNGEQVGVVSFGHKDCLAAKPSVFTRLTEYTNWLKENSDIKL